MRSTLLHPLKIAFSPYAEHWPQWKHSGFSKFTKSEIELLDTFVEKEFVVPLQEFKSLLQHLQTISILEEKLSSSEEQLKQWWRQHNVQAGRQ